MPELSSSLCCTVLCMHCVYRCAAIFESGTLEKFSVAVAFSNLACLEPVPVMSVYIQPHQRRSARMAHLSWKRKIANQQLSGAEFLGKRPVVSEHMRQTKNLRGVQLPEPCIDIRDKELFASKCV